MAKAESIVRPQSSNPLVEIRPASSCDACHRAAAVARDRRCGADSAAPASAGTTDAMRVRLVAATAARPNRRDIRCAFHERSQERTCRTAQQWVPTPSL
jgi:hypothetical protein